MKFIPENPLKYLSVQLPLIGGIILTVIIPLLQLLIDYQIIPQEYHAILTGGVMVGLTWIGKKIAQPKLQLNNQILGFTSAVNISPNEFKGRMTTQLYRDEGEKLYAYQDTLGFWTIGIGRLIDKRKGGGISKEESSYLLSNDIDSKIAELENKLPWINKLDDARKGVLVNMAFQMGVSGLLGFKNTLALVQKGDYLAASKGMLNSLWAKQTPNRAKRLSEQMRLGQWQ